MDSRTYELDTHGRRLLDVTDHVRGYAGEQTADGLLHVFLPHATAGLALFETGAGTEADVMEVLDRLAPADDRWQHRHGSPGHGRDHVIPALLCPSLTLPVVAGRLQLGTWQSVVVVDTNADNPTRTLRLSFLAG